MLDKVLNRPLEIPVKNLNWLHYSNESRFQEK